jgi:transcriptional regulator with XRE-family HTH domain
MDRKQMFAEILRSEMAARKLSLAKLASLSGVSKQYLHKLTQASSSPTLEMLHKIAAALKVRPSLLLCDQRPKKKVKKTS